MSTGVIGLIAAIDNFDPSHNVKLKTYAEYKIRGAILDSLRGLDWAPRQKRRKAKQIEAAIASAEQRCSVRPPKRKSPRNWRLSLEEYHEWLVEIRGLNIAQPGVCLRETRERPAALYVRDERRATFLRRCSKSPELERLLAEGDRRHSRRWNVRCSVSITTKN